MMKLRIEHVSPQEVCIILAEQLQRNALEAVARMERRLNAAERDYTDAKDALASANVTLDTLRRTYLETTQ